jgi:hypothetical protein
MAGFSHFSWLLALREVVLLFKLVAMLLLTIVVVLSNKLVAKLVAAAKQKTM